MLCEAGMVYPLGQIHPQQVDNPALAHLSVDGICSHSDIRVILNGVQMDSGDCHFQSVSLFSIDVVQFSLISKSCV